MSDRVVHSLTNQAGAHAGWMIFCPACQCGHLFDARWTFNGDLDRPTFTPSMLVHEAVWPDGERSHHRCHSFVTDGVMRFLGDCTHDMAGQNVQLEHW